MSILKMIQSASLRIGITSPDTVIGNPDKQVQQLLAIANEEGQELAERYSGWQALQKKATFTTVAQNDQGDINTIADGLKYIINQTIWNRSQRRPVLGPLSPRDWQMLQASPVTGPFDQFRIRGDRLLFDPIPAAGEDCAFEYISENWCESSDGVGQDEWMNDADVGRLDEKIMIQGIIWRWKQIKGFDYAEDFRKYEIRVTDAMGRDSTKPELNLNGGPVSFQPGIFVPQTGYGQ